jgi:hypothetical protein
VVQLVEQHVIKRADRRFAAIDRAAFASMNLYNAANYELRQSYIVEGVYLSYPEMHQRMKDHEAYTALPAKVAQQVLRMLDKNWQSFFAALEAWKADPSTFLGRPGCRATSTSSRAATCWSTPFRHSVSRRCATI